MIAVKDADSNETDLSYFEAIFDDPEEAGAMHALHVSRVAWAEKSREVPHGAG